MTDRLTEGELAFYAAQDDLPNLSRLAREVQESRAEIERLRYRLGMESISRRYTVGELADLAVVCDGLDADTVEAALRWYSGELDPDPLADWRSRSER